MKIFVPIIKIDAAQRLVYGYSPVRQVLMTVNIALHRQLWQLDYFTEGSIPDALIGVLQNWRARKSPLRR
jgi:hypothetical protein